MKLDTLTFINLLVGTGLPVAVAYITSHLAESRVKVLALVTLATLTSVLTTIIDAGSADVNWRYYAGSFVTQFGGAVVAHFGVLKGIKITGPEGAVTKTGLQLGSPVAEAETATKKTTSRRRPNKHKEAGLTEIGLIVVCSLVAVAVVIIFLVLTNNAH